MPAISDILRQRSRRGKARKGSRTVQRTALSLTTIASLGVAVLAVALTAGFSLLTQDMPSLASLPALLDPQEGLLAEPSVIVARDQATVLQTLGGGERSYLPLESASQDRLPPNLLNAIVAAADPAFWQHGGIDLRNLAGAAPDTIALQLVSELLFWDEPSGLRRALRERLFAAQAVSEYGHEQILEWYLNIAFFGQNAYGAEAAAQLYFGKAAAELSLAESAVLAATSQAPDLNPFASPDLALARRNETLNRMHEQGFITAEQLEDARRSTLGVRPAPEQPNSVLSAFLNLVRQEIAPHIPERVLARGGLVIVSTLDPDLQRQFECTLESQLARLSAQATDFPEDCRAARLLPTQIGENEPAAGLTAELAAIDPRAGQVLALAAGHSGGRAPEDLTPHPGGSLLTPFVYLTAFTRGFSPGSLAWDIPANLPAGLNRSPNPDEAFHGPVRIRTALANDYLVPALSLLDQIGAEAVWGTAAQLGMPALLSPVAENVGSIDLDRRQLTLLEAVQAFGVLSTQGVLIGRGTPGPPNAGDLPAPLQATTVLRVEDARGTVWLDFGPPQARPVTSAPLAYTLTHMLSDESARWPSLGHPNALEVGRPAGVKRGFTQDSRNAWAVGFTPQVSIGAWIGFLGGSTDAGQVSPDAAAGLWHAALKYATESQEPAGWSVPQDIVSLEVCDPSGMLPTAECPTVVREIFLQGSEPTQPDSLFRRFAINRETGLLATVFTPPELIEERVFLVPPPEAAAWAQQAGLPVPPENYDLVSQPPVDSEQVRIQSPAMFDYVSGDLVIRGAAYGPDFENFSVQIGAGLNPQQWLQLGDPSTTPVFEGELARWNTGGLSGLYAIRLLVVRQDSRIETSIVQVTVDNTPPEVGILYPAESQVFEQPGTAPATFQFFAADELEIGRVEVYQDNRLLETMTRPPYALSVSLQPGAHILRVVAYDLAGNFAETEISYIVAR